MYDEGLGVPQDYAEAAAWYRKAAELGDAHAQHNLGNSYHYGRGVKQDDTEAVKWYRKAAEQNFANAQNSLGSLYAEGRGVSQDEAEAIKWHRKAAELGDPNAQFNVGLWHTKHLPSTRPNSFSLAVSQDIVQAHMWFSLAAAQGLNQAQQLLGVIAGIMTPDQLAEAQRMAREWMEKHQQ